jgi:hypothetical protein
VNNSRSKASLTNGLWILLLVYTAASLLHFVHNAVFVDEYPNMPEWLSSLKVMGAWCLVAAVGVAGCLLLYCGWRVAGLLMLAVYGALGLDGLGHYSLAPLSAHSPMMNLTIWFEVLTGAMVLILMSIQTVKEVRM